MANKGFLMSATNTISLTKAEAILDKFAQLKDGGKLCFKADEVSLETASSFARTASSWGSYAWGSGWSRDINDLTGIVAKVSVCIEQQISTQSIEADQVLILADKVQSALQGLEILKSAYQQPALQSAKVQVVEGAISQLEKLSEKMMKSLTLMAQQINNLKKENAHLTGLLLSQNEQLSQQSEALSSQSQQLASLTLAYQQLQVELASLKVELEEVKKTAGSEEKEETKASEADCAVEVEEVVEKDEEEEAFFASIAARRKEIAADREANARIKQRVNDLRITSQATV